MPPRKSNVSAISNGADDVAESTPVRATPKEKEKDGLSVEDLSLPKSMIGRLAKGVLPANTQIHKDALLALHKSATVFVSYIASGSNDNAQASGKKTIAPQDVLAALKDAELEGFIPRLEAELKKYNDTQCDKRNTYRRKVKEEKAAAAGPDDSEVQANDDGSALLGVASNGQLEEEDGSGPPVKKVKGENGNSFIADDDNGDDGGDDDDENAENSEDEDEDDDAAEDGEDGEEENESDEGEDDQMDDEEDAVARNELQDEALDEPDSD